MKKLMNRVKYVMTGEDGASNLELIIWFSVVLVIATTLFVFRDKIVNFLNKAGTKVDNLKVS